MARRRQLLARVTEQLLDSRAGLTMLRVLGAVLSRVAPYRPVRRELPPELTASRVAVKVATSTLPGAGLGLFAAEDIPSNTVIGEFCGDIVPSILKAMRMKERRYLARKKGGAYIDSANHPEVMMRYICHHPRSERRNCELELPTELERRTVRTTRAVVAGEELFCDYGSAYWKAVGIEPVGD